MADQKITQLVDGGAPQATDEFVIARAGDNFKVDYASLESASLAGAVILAPAASARNVIQPTAGAVIAAIVKAHAAQSVNLMEWQDSAGGVLMRVALDGGVLIETNTDFTTALILKSNDPASNQQETFQIKDSSGATAFEVQNCGETLWRFLEPAQSAGLAVIDQVGIAGHLLSVAAVAGEGIEIRNDGSLVIVNTSGAALVAAGTFFPWLDPTNGAAKLMVKGATLDGTVVTWEFEDGVYSPGGGGAPTSATYITQTPDAGLSAEQALSALATGLVKNTTGTGVLSIGAQGTDYYAPGGTDVAVADGGTGASTAAGARTNLDVPSNAEAVLDTLYDANTVLAADSDNTPAALTMGASTILARLAAGNIKAATPAELRTLLDVPTTGEAILDTLVDAKGDLIVGTAADTVARLAAGADGTVPVADTNSSAGMLWTRRFGQTSYIPTVYYGNMGGAAPAAGGYGLNVLYCVPIYIGRRQAFDRIALRCGGGTATLVVRLGIWSGDDGPTTLVLDAGTIDGASAIADKTITIAQTLDPGLYWLGGSTQVATPIGSFTAVKSGTSTVWQPGLWRADSISQPSRSWARASITGAFTNLTSVAGDFAQSQEGMAIMLRAV